MLTLAFEARMRTKDDHGVTRRASLEASATRGNPEAIAALEPPPEYPDSLEYLREWAHELVGTSGDSMNGLTPLTWTTLDAWARRTGLDPSPEECRALRMLDAALRDPESVERVPESTPDASVQPADIPAWPQ